MMTAAKVALARAWIRYAPVSLGKPWLWERVRWRQFDFRSRTRAGLEMHGNTTDVIQRYLHYFGVWEPDVSAVVASRLREGDVFVDIGANVGYYTLLAAKLVGPSGLVVAFEPSPSIMEHLKSNVSANGLSNVRVVQKAVSDRRGVLRLFEGPPDNIGHTSLIPTDAPSVEVEVAPASELLRDIDPQRIRVIKIDVEGAELEALRGLTPLLELATRADVLMEVSSRHMPGGQQAVDTVFSEMRRLGFSAYRVPNDYEETRYLTMPPPQAPQPIDEEHPACELADILFTRTAAVH